MHSVLMPFFKSLNGKSIIKNVIDKRQRLRYADDTACMTHSEMCLYHLVGTCTRVADSPTEKD